MDHLKEVGLTYFQHMQFALKNCMKLFVASILLALHSIMPNWFTNSGSKLVQDIHYDFTARRLWKSRILVRFNTKWKEDPEGRKWRVLQDGVETLAHSVNLTIPCTTIQEDVAEGTRWHFLCWGDVEWDNASNAKIV
jgi:hypothetical protein